MNKQKFLEDFINKCSETKPESTEEKFIGWEGIIFTLVGFGLKTMLPELKEWIKLGVTAIAFKRQEIKKKLIDYAKEKELDFRAAEKAAEVVADKINEENVEKLIDALES